MDLINASVGAIVDERKSWPQRGNLDLDGFVYERISSGPKDADSRLEWLNLQDSFTPQPYRQLASVLLNAGDEGGARQVLYEMEHRSWSGDRRRAFRCWGQVLRATVGYGIYPERAIWCLSTLTAVGWILHRRAKLAGAMAPTDKDAYSEFHRHNGHVPTHYPPFVPLIYSFENCVPLVKLGQDEKWQADSNPLPNLNSIAPARKGLISRVSRWIDLLLVRLPPPTPAFLRWCRWVLIGLGWLLATFFVAGITGIIKKG